MAAGFQGWRENELSAAQDSRSGCRVKIVSSRPDALVRLDFDALGFWQDLQQQQRQQMHQRQILTHALLYNVDA
jgi:hypothetical protein